MNPENVGQHIPLRHSSLWRKPLLYEKKQKELPLCHLQLNQLGSMGQSWRTRNNQIHLNYTFHKNQTRPMTATQKSKESDKPTNVEGVAVGEAKVKSSKLAQSMVKQKKDGESEAGSITLAAYPAVGRYPWVYNDYHSRMVNSGYSRNVKGKHFTR